eukprot:m.14200 g.14200  ORF g.14200 m.14200 type:complete len:1137 (+) comp8308_c0_seq1:328-3738(+)
MGGGASKQKKKKKDLTTDTVTSHDGGESRPKPPPYTNGSGATHTATNEGCSLVCPECCAVNSESVNFCGECGQQIGQPQPNAESIATDVVVNIVEEHRAAADERGTQSTNKKKGKRKAVEQEQEQGERMVLTNNSTNNDADGTEAVETYAIDEPFTPDIETSSSHFLEAAPSTTAARPRNGKTVDFRQARPRTASGATLKFLDRDSYAERLTAYCGYIFSKADLDGDNALSIDEFAALVQSRTLDLDISDTDCGLMMKDYDQTNGGVAIGFSDFVYVMTDLMRRHSQRLKIDGHAAWEWFVLYFDDDPDSLPLYFNTERLAMTYDKPAGIDFREQDQDEQVFEIMVHNGTGAVYTTLVDETGQRMYLDTESGEWCPIPDDWYGEMTLEADHGLDNVDFDFGPDDNANDEATRETMHERFTHPRTGVEFESMVENGKRLYFGASSGEWVLMPLMLEICVPSVAKMLQQLADAHPGWKNVREKMMALRSNRYNVEDVAMWKFKENMYDDCGGGGDPNELLDRIRANDDTVAAGELDRVREEMSDQVRELERGVREVEAALERANAEKVVMIKNQDTIIGDADQLRATLAERDREVAVLQARQLELETQLTATKSSDHAQMEAAAIATRQLEIRVKELTEQLETNAGQGGSLETTLKERETALEQARAEVAELGNKLAVAVAAQQVITQRADVAEATLASRATQSEGMSKKVADFESTNRARTMALTGMASLLANLKGDHKALRDLVTADFVPGTLEAMKSTRTRLAERCSTVVEDATKDLVTRYRFEVRQRKLLYNQLQEIKGNIRVFCRVRHDDRVTCALEFPDKSGLGTATEILCPNPRDVSEKKKFAFDVVFNPENTQKDVFDDTEPVMTSCVDGYNVCIIAYGQTGSGKTYTMMGTEDNPGVNRRAVAELLRVCAEREQVEYTVKVSLLEIYNERFVDLLTDIPVMEQQCDLRQDPKTKQAYVTNLTARTVTSIENVVQTLNDGEKNRSTASTKMNSVSSRSHLLLQLQIEGRDKIGGQVTNGKLTMVDLAGSERISKTAATGQRLVEAAAINKSLSALGQVFTALRVGQSHVPYRNSKLTHILEDSLGGNAKTCVFINVSPAESNLPETQSTLQFGAAITKITKEKKEKSGKK